MKTTLSQRQRILKHLQSGKPLTAMQALDKFGCFRLAARIDNLRNEGWQIDSTIKTKNGKRFAQYKMLCFDRI